MTLIDFEGFEGITTLAARGWSLVTDSINGNVAVGAYGLHGDGLRITSNHATDQLDIIGRAIPDTIEGFMGFSFKRTGVSGERAICRLVESGTSHLTLTVTDAGQFNLYRGTQNGTLLASSALLSYTMAEWAYLEFHFLIDNTTGFFELRVEETVVLSFTGDTRNGGTDGVIDTLQFLTNAPSGGVGTTDHYYDDLYILDAGGAAPHNDYLGPRRVDRIRPDANDAVAFTPSAGSNFQNVDDTASDGDTTYNETAGADVEDIFTMSALPAPSVEILAVKMTSVARRTDAGPRPLVNRLVSGATQQDGVTHALGESFAEYSDIVELNPDGDVAWDDAAITALKGGYATPP